MKHILVGVDGRHGGRDAIELAQLFAEPGSRITLAHVHSSSAATWQSVERQEARREAGRRLLESERELAGVHAALAVVGDATVGSGLRKLAKRTNADILVVGSCHRGAVGRVLLGNDARSAMSGAPCPVAIAPAHYVRPPELTRIGVGYDDSREAKAALGLARELVRVHGGRIMARAVISLQDLPYGEPIPEGWPKIALELMDDARGRLRAFGDIDGDATYGDPGPQLAELSEDVDLLLVGSRDYGRIDRLFESSCAGYLAQHSRSPLVVVPRSALTVTDPSSDRCEPQPVA